MAQGGQEKSDNTYNLLWLMFLLAMGSWLLWTYLRVELKTFFVYLKYYQLKALYLPMQYTPMSSEIFYSIEALEQLIKNPDGLDADIASSIATTVGNIIRFPIAIILGGLGLRYWLNNIQSKFKSIYDMKKLSKNQKNLWPQIKPVAELNLIDEDIDKGPWAMAQTPIIYSKKNKLVKIEIAPSNDQILGREPKFKVTLIPSAVEKVFSAQLGRAFQEVSKMPPHRRAIFAIFAARGARDTATALAMIGQLATGAAIGKMDYTGIDTLWQKHINHIRVKEICAQHAYELTLLASMLIFAREDGVVPSSDFLWVKPLDRKLWYVINTIGRQTPYVEVAAIFSHWVTENALKRALSVPQITQACKALDIALNEMVYTPDKEERELLLNAKVSGTIVEGAI